MRHCGPGRQRRQCPRARRAMAARDRRHLRTNCSRLLLLLCGLLIPGPAAMALLSADEQGSASRPPADGLPDGRRGTTQVDGREPLQKAAVLVQRAASTKPIDRRRSPWLTQRREPSRTSILGGIRVQQNKLPAGVGLLRKAIELEPGLIGARLTLAQVYAIQGKEPLAAELYRHVLALDPSNATARQALARAEIDKGNCQGALTLARPVLDVFRQSPEGLSMLAVCFLKSGDRAAVSDLASRWTQLPDAPPTATIQFARLLLQGGALADGIVVLERAKASSPSSYDLAIALGGAYALNGDAAGARVLRSRADAPALSRPKRSDRPLSSPNATTSWNERSPTGCVRRRSSLATLISCWDSAVSV